MKTESRILDKFKQKKLFTVPGKSKYCQGIFVACAENLPWKMKIVSEGAQFSVIPYLIFSSDFSLLKLKHFL